MTNLLQRAVDSILGVRGPSGHCGEQRGHRHRRAPLSSHLWRKRSGNDPGIPTLFGVIVRIRDSTSTVYVRSGQNVLEVST
jgi:hypothetical protein